MEQTTNVLIVDDLAQNIQVAANILQKSGYNILAALNGEIAMNILNSKKVDLVLLDISMPVMDGFEVCRRMMESDTLKAIPVIFLSSSQDTDDVVYGLQLGAVDYIRKPFNAKELSQRVATHLKIIEQQNTIKAKVNELEIKNKELNELNATKDRFFSILGHDLKNPFTIIMGFVKVLKNNIHKYEMNKIVSFLDNIDNSATNAHKLLENLLTWSRSQTGRIQFMPQKVSLIQVFASALTLHLGFAMQKKITLEDLLEENINVLADVDMLNTIIRNLVSNALKFTNEYGKVSLNATIKGDFALISVCDNGIGMSEKLKNKLFKIDNSTSREGTNHEKGTGLGLILCKEFIDKHSGEIYVESEVGKGSCFCFTVPLVR